MAKASDNPFPSVLLVEGGTPATPAAGQQRLFVDSTDGALKKVDDAGAVSAVGGSSSGGILAYTEYNPATMTAMSSTSTTSVDVDATNLAVTFTAPASGRVLVRFTALGGVTGGAGAEWQVREATAVLKTRYMVTGAADFAGVAAFVVSGLAAGSVHTYKWGYSTTAGSTVKVTAGGVAGPAVMEIHALP